MSTLRDIWIGQGLTSAQVAGRARISVTTLYKANRKEEDINFRTVKAICEVLGMSLDDFEHLDACPHASEYRGEQKK